MDGLPWLRADRGFLSSIDKTAAAAVVLRGSGPGGCLGFQGTVYGRQAFLCYS